MATKNINAKDSRSVPVQNDINQEEASKNIFHPAKEDIETLDKIIIKLRNNLTNLNDPEKSILTDCENDILEQKTLLSTFNRIFKDIRNSKSLISHQRLKKHENFLKNKNTDSNETKLNKDCIVHYVTLTEIFNETFTDLLWAIIQCKEKLNKSTSPNLALNDNQETSKVKFKPIKLYDVLCEDDVVRSLNDYIIIQDTIFEKKRLEKAKLPVNKDQNDVQIMLNEIEKIFQNKNIAEIHERIEKIRNILIKISIYSIKKMYNELKEHQTLKTFKHGEDKLINGLYENWTLYNIIESLILCSNKNNALDIYNHLKIELNYLALADKSVNNASKELILKLIENLCSKCKTVEAEIGKTELKKKLEH